MYAPKLMVHFMQDHNVTITAYQVSDLLIQDQEELKKVQFNLTLGVGCVKSKLNSELTRKYTYYCSKI